MHLLALLLVEPFTWHATALRGALEAAVLKIAFLERGRSKERFATSMLSVRMSMNYVRTYLVMQAHRRVGPKIPSSVVSTNGRGANVIRKLETCGLDDVTRLRFQNNSSSTTITKIRGLAVRLEWAGRYLAGRRPSGRLCD